MSAGAAGHKEDESDSQIPRPLYLIFPDYRVFGRFAKANGRLEPAGMAFGRRFSLRRPAHARHSPEPLEAAEAAKSSHSA
jgi:hypothetical protein